MTRPTLRELYRAALKPRHLHAMQRDGLIADGRVETKISWVTLPNGDVLRALEQDVFIVPVAPVEFVTFSFSRNQNGEPEPDATDP